MRSERQLPGQLWPHEMVITIENHDHRICELLWARDAYRITPGVTDDPPPIRPEPMMPPGNHPAAALRRAWAPLWLRLWREALGWYATDPVDADPMLCGLAADESVQLEELIRAAGPRSWSDAVEEDNFDRFAFMCWDHEAVELLGRVHRLGEPEDGALSAVIAAWRRGLSRIVEIPTIGEYTRKLGAGTLLVTSETRSDAFAYSLALNSFEASN